jgi:glycosyltransferase involved in cell wall biosynthesis
LHPIGREGPLKMSFILEAARFIRQQHIQVVHGHHGRDYWRVVLAARLSGVRPKVVLHRYLAKSLGTWVSRQFLLNRTDAFIAGSHCVARILTEGLFEPDSPEPERRARPSIRGDHRKVRVIHGGVDTERFYPKDASRLREDWKLHPENVVFAVVAGYPKPRGKGQREFLAAAARLSMEHPEARFLVIGRGDLEQTLREDIERLNLGGYAWLTPWCQDMPAVMNAIDCLVHPQVGTDAFPTVILEAMACGKPVVATRVDGAVEQVVHGKTGLIVEPEDISGLAEAIRAILQGGELRRAQFGADARERVCANFGLPLLAKRVLSLYRELCHTDVPLA